MTVTKFEGPIDDLEVHTARPLAAAGLSVLWPGFGHALLGRTSPAVGFVLAQVVVVVLTVLPGAWQVTGPAWVLLVLASAWSAWRTARAARRRPLVRPFH